MGYRWKPNASQKAAYRERCLAKEELPLIKTNHPIRNGCKLKFYSMNKGEIIEGEVVNSSYGCGHYTGQNNFTGEQLYTKGQHTFTILKEDGTKLLVKGRNLYPNLLEHIPGEIAKQKQ